MNGNLKWFAQEKINNKKNSVVQKKEEYNDVINKYLQKSNNQIRKLLILSEEDIDSYKAFKKSYRNENNGLTLIGTSLEEYIQDSKMNQGKKKKSLSTIKARNIIIGQLKLCILTRLKRKLKTKK